MMITLVIVMIMFVMCRNVPLFITGYTSLSNISCAETVNVWLRRPISRCRYYCFMIFLNLLRKQIRKLHIGYVYVYSSPSQAIAHNKLYARLMACCAAKPPPPPYPHIHKRSTLRFNLMLFYIFMLLPPYPASN